MKTYIKSPTRQEWESMRGPWSTLSNAIGSMDEIYRPIVEPQEHCVSGHRQYHAINTQVIVDNTGIIRVVQSGFPGHLNDAQQYALMEQIGIDIEFPNDIYLLGDKIYPNHGQVSMQFSAQQLAKKEGLERRNGL